jgi:hypothetical protein
VEGSLDDLSAQGTISTNAGEVKISEIHAKPNEWKPSGDGRTFDTGKGDDFRRPPF